MLTGALPPEKPAKVKENKDEGDAKSLAPSIWRATPTKGFQVVIGNTLMHWSRVQFDPIPGSNLTNAWNLISSYIAIKDKISPQPPSPIIRPLCPNQFKFTS